MLALQQSAGNHAVTRRLQRQVSGDAWFGEDYMQLLAVAIDEYVQEAYHRILNEPDSPALAGIDGHTRAWLKSYASFKRTQDPDFLYATFGYAVESVAGQKIEKMSLAAGYTVSLQGNRGPTRPDIVVKLNGKDHGWYDITSKASEGHILKKTGTGWKTLPNVCEITYPTLNPMMFAAHAPTLAQRGQALYDITEAQTIRAKKEQRLGWLQANLPAPLGGFNKALKRTDFETKLGPVLGLPGKATPSLAKGVLAIAGVATGQYGYTGAKGKGPNTEAAKELLYTPDVLQVSEQDAMLFNQTALHWHAELNPPTAGLPREGLFDEEPTVQGFMEVPPVPFYQAPQRAPQPQTGQSYDDYFSPENQFDMLGPGPQQHGGFYADDDDPFPVGFGFTHGFGFGESEGMDVDK